MRAAGAGREHTPSTARAAMELKGSILIRSGLIQVTPTASFTTDLGLDSLDAVEVVMAVSPHSLWVLLTVPLYTC